MVTKIVLADDHQLNRQALVYWLREEKDMEVCADVGNGEDALRAVRTHQPHVLLLDLKMPGMDGFAVLAALKQQQSKVKTIVHTGYSNEQNIVRCVELGAVGVLPKDSPLDESTKAITGVVHSGTYFSVQVLRMLKKAVSDSKKFKPRFDDDTVHFSGIDKQVVYYYCLGYTSAQIGEVVHLSPRTVEGHKEKIMEKVKVNKFSDVVIYCHQKRLIDLDSIPLRPAID